MAAAAAEATELPNIFFIIGAPTSKTAEAFSEFIEFTKNKNVKLVICAAMPTYIEALKTKTVSKTPTNFRAHADDVRTFYTANGDITTDNVENFKKLQEDIAKSLYNIFHEAKDKKIPTYFGIVKRENRPTWLNKTKWVKVEEFPKKLEDYPQLKKAGKFKTWFEYKDGTKIIPSPNSDKNLLTEGRGAYACEYSPPYKANYFDRELTEKIRDELLIPKVYGNAKNLAEKICNDKISKYGATFLSDMITVGCAGLIENNGLWDSYTISKEREEPTKQATYSENSYSLFGKGKVDVVQENLDFEPDPNGTFFGYIENKRTIDLLTTKMHNMIDQNDKMFDNCYVWHDDELNDLDDQPALALIEKLSHNYIPEINYNKELVETQNIKTDELRRELAAKAAEAAEAAKDAKAAKGTKGGHRRSKLGKKKKTKKNKKNTKKKQNKKRRNRKSKKRRNGKSKKRCR